MNGTDLALSIAEAIRQLDEDEVLGIEVGSDVDHDGAGRYIQFVASGQGMIRAEAVSNAFLAPALRLSLEQQVEHVRIGWGRPQPTVRNASPNYFVDVEVAWADFVADLAARTITEIWGVSDLDDLVVRDDHDVFVPLVGDSVA